MKTFIDWSHMATDWHAPLKIPDHQRIMHALAAAGRRGLGREEIGGLVGLSYRTVEALLAALVAIGEIAMTREGERRVYRAVI
jgi:hypothetical protein